MATTKPASTTTQRVFFTKDDTALPLPNLMAHQRSSWQEFVETGLSEIFSELNPIEDYTGQKLELRFGKYAFQDPKNSEQFAKENNITVRLVIIYRNFVSMFYSYLDFGTIILSANSCFNDFISVKTI